MKKYFVFLTITIFSLGVCAQTVQTNSANAASTSVTVDADALALAKSAREAHGGDKFKNMKTLVIRGTADVSATPSQTIPATFAFVYAGEKYRIDITNPLQPLKQIFDGEQTFSSINGFSFPPINRLGMPMLQRFDEKGFTVSALPEKLKKKRGFRITSPEGYYTDFLLDDKSGQIKSYQSSYDVNGKIVTTSVDIDKVRNVEGVVVPEQYAQRFELGTLTIYAAFKAKEILVNTKVQDDVFAIPK